MKDFGPTPLDDLIAKDIEKENHEVFCDLASYYFGEALASGRVTMEQLEASKWDGCRFASYGSDDSGKDKTMKYERRFDTQTDGVPRMNAQITNIGTSETEFVDQRRPWYVSPTQLALLPKHFPEMFERKLTHAEIVARCQELGLLVCTCLPVEGPRGPTLLYHPSCPVHESLEWKSIQAKDARP